MKKSIYLFFTLFIFATAFYVTSCKKDPVNNPPAPMPVDEAMVEIRSASQDITGSMDEFMATQAFVAVDVFMGLVSFEEEEEWKSALKPSLREIEGLQISHFKNLINEKFYVKSISEPDPAVGGVYKYNYTTEDFDLINSGVSYLQFLFPADDADFYNQGWNATLTVSNYQYVTIDLEEIPTMFNVELTVYSASVMEMNYTATYDVDGIPTSMSVSIDMPPYSLTMSESVSGTNYNSTFSFKENNYVLMSYSITTTLTADKVDIVKVSGHYQVSPLRIDGYVNVLDMDNCIENDTDCMNSNMSLTLIHTDLNQIIGTIEARLFYDEYYQEYYPDAVIVYADDTWEWLADIFDVDFRK